MSKPRGLDRSALIAVACLAAAVACSGDGANEDDSMDAAGTSGSGGSGGRGLTGLGGSGSPSASAGGGGRAGSSASGGSGGSGSAGRPSAGLGGGGALAGTGGVPNAGAGSGGATSQAGAAGAAGASGASGAAGNPDSEEVTYSADVQPLLEQSCSPCHSVLSFGGHNAAASYSDAVRVADDMLDEIESGGMPPACNGGDVGDPSCVSEADLELIQQWVDDDTPE